MASNSDWVAKLARLIDQDVHICSPSAKVDGGPVDLNLGKVYSTRSNYWWSSIDSYIIVVFFVVRLPVGIVCAAVNAGLLVAGDSSLRVPDWSG